MWKSCFGSRSFDNRFDVVSPASGCGGATMDNPTTKQSSYQGHVYPWG